MTKKIKHRLDKAENLKTKRKDLRTVQPVTVYLSPEAYAKLERRRARLAKGGDVVSITRVIRELVRDMDEPESTIPE